MDSVKGADVFQLYSVKGKTDFFGKGKQKNKIKNTWQKKIKRLEWNKIQFFGKVWKAEKNSKSSWQTVLNSLECKHVS